jgi:hypothetical protein
MLNPLVLSRVRYCLSPSPLHFLSPRPGFIYSLRRSRAFVHKDAVARSTAEPEEFIIPPIFDIFDAPSRLGQRTEFIQSTTSGPHKSVDKDVSRSIDSSLPHPPPSVLPPPIIFDGPACPKSLPILSFQRVGETLNLKHASARQIKPHRMPFLLHSASESLVEVFDGPARARLTRFSQRNSRLRRVSIRALCP